MEPTETLAGLTLAEFSEQLASGAPVPGGGSASAVVGSLAGSLLAMVARLSLDRPKYESYRATIEQALAAGEHGRLRLMALADDDAAAYGRFAAAMKLPHATEDEQAARNEQMRGAARAASEVPLAVVRECAVLLDQLESMAGRSNVNAASDLEVGSRLAAAAARGAAANVMINLPFVDDARYSGAVTAELDGLLETIERDSLSVARHVASGGLREPETAQPA